MSHTFHIISFRHWEKENWDIDGNLSENGYKQALDTWKRIGDILKDKSIIYMWAISSPISRVQKTTEGIQKSVYSTVSSDKKYWNSIVTKNYLWLNMFPKDFTTQFTEVINHYKSLNSESSNEEAQAYAASEFMKGNFSVQPKDIAESFIKKLNTLYTLLKRRPSLIIQWDHDKLILAGTHQTINESVLITLCSWFNKLPPERQSAFWYTEEIYYDIIPEDNKLIISFRGITKEFTLPISIE